MRYLSLREILGDIHQIEQFIQDLFMKQYKLVLVSIFFD